MKRRLAVNRIDPLTRRMARNPLRRAAKVYREGVLAPLAAQVAKLPAGGDQANAQANAQQLERMRDALPSKLLDQLDSQGLAERIAELGVQAELVGAAAAEQLVAETETEET